MRRVIWVLIPLYASMLLTTRLRAETQAVQAQSGTINLLIADRNKMVLVTDSRSSSADGSFVDDHAQKLFRLDNQTACSIAGLGTDPGPRVAGRFIRKLAVAPGGIIYQYATEIATREA